MPSGGLVDDFVNLLLHLGNPAGSEVAGHRANGRVHELVKGRTERMALTASGKEAPAADIARP
jgi:hypothetical protein